MFYVWGFAGSGLRVWRFGALGLLQVWGLGYVLQVWGFGYGGTHPPSHPHHLQTLPPSLRGERQWYRMGRVLHGPPSLRGGMQPAAEWPGTTSASCITQLKAQGPSRTCNASKEEEEEEDHFSRLKTYLTPSPDFGPSLLKSALFTREWIHGRGSCEPLLSEYGTYKTVKARFWCGLSGKSPSNP